MKNRRKRQPPLDKRHYIAIELLSESRLYNQEDIAKALGISRMTLYRWRQRQDFRRELEKAIRRKMNARFGSLQRAWKRYIEDAIGKGNVEALGFIHEMLR